MKCPICDSNKWNIDITGSKILALTDIYKVLICKDCSLRCIYPQITPAELDELYSGAYFNNEESLSETLGDIAKSTSSYIDETVKVRYPKFKDSLREIKLLKPDAVTLLDVGAATGDFVKIAKDFGFKAEGIEFSAYAIAKAKENYGIELEQKALVDVQKNEYYDIIHLNHVFEHFNAPLVEVKNLYRLIKTGGLLYIEIPFQFHFIERLLYIIKRPQTKFSLHSIHHPFFYTPSLISRLLTQNGFEIVKISVFDPSRYVAVTFMGRVKKNIWKLVSLFKIGNHIEIFARKK